MERSAPESSWLQLGASFWRTILGPAKSQGVMLNTHRVGSLNRTAILEGATTVVSCSHDSSTDPELIGQRRENGPSSPTKETPMPLRYKFRGGRGFRLTRGTLGLCTKDGLEEQA